MADVGERGFMPRWGARSIISTPDRGMNPLPQEIADSRGRGFPEVSDVEPMPRSPAVKVPTIRLDRGMNPLPRKIPESGWEGLYAPIRMAAKVHQGLPIGG